MTPGSGALTASGWVCHSLKIGITGEKANLGERSMLRGQATPKWMHKLGKWMNVSGIQERSRFGIHQRITYRGQGRDEMADPKRERSKLCMEFWKSQAQKGQMKEKEKVQ